MGFEERATALVATAAKIARLQGLGIDVGVLETATASIAQTGYAEDWGERVDFYTLMLEVPIEVYAAIDRGRSQLEKRLQARFAELARTTPSARITEVVISPELAEGSRPTQLAPPTDSQAEEEPPSFWQPGCFRLFISHTAANKESAHRLKEGVAKYHIAAFVAHDDIEPAKEWEAEIERALRTTDALAAIITSDFAASRWCDQEVGYALGRGKLVLPLCKDAVIPHGFLGKYQACKAQGLLAATVAEQVYNLLLNNELTSQRMMDAIVDRMVTSGSFDTSRNTMKLLEKLPRLSDSQVTKLIQASETNSQIFKADGITERIQRLVSKVGTGV
jgi:TIR domain